MAFLKRLINNAYGMGDVPTQTPTLDAFYTNADNIIALKQSFDNILNSIFDSLSYGNVKVIDGLTTDAMSTNIEDGKVDGIKYTVTDDKDNTVYTVAATGEIGRAHV